MARPYHLSISTGERKLIRKNTERISGWIFDLGGKLRLATRVADNGDEEVLRVDANGFTKIYSCNVFEECAPVKEINLGSRTDHEQVWLVIASGDTEPGEEDFFSARRRRTEVRPI